MNEPTRFTQGLDAWIEQLSANGGGWSADLRKAAATRYRALGLPGKRDEDWRQINLTALAREERTVPDRPGRVDDLERFAIEGLDPIRVVLVDGYHVPTLGDDFPAGLDLTSAYSGEGNELVESLRRSAGHDATSLEALNAAWYRDGLVLRVAKGVRIERPIHVLHVSTAHDGPTAVHPRLLLVTGESSQVTVIEDHVALEGSDDFVNAVVELRVGANSQVDWVRVVRTGGPHLHVASTRCHQERDSRLRHHALVVDGELVRHDLRCHLQGSGSEVEMNGLVVLDGAQVADNHTWVFHEVPHTRSDERYRNVLDGKSRGVFMGRVVVAEGAKGTDAQQNNANLLLSDEAQVNTLPQLEIYNDDVKASHGATLGQLDRDGLFYLRSRGIDEATARGLLTFAFASTVVEALPLPELRTFARRRIFEHLPHDHLSEELV